MHQLFSRFFIQVQHFVLSEASFFDVQPCGAENGHRFLTCNPAAQKTGHRFLTCNPAAQKTTVVF